MTNVADGMTNPLNNTLEALVHYVSADDWAAVYLGNEMFYEGHSIPHFVWLDLLRKVGASTDDRFAEDDVAYSWADELGRFPATFEEFINHDNAD
jgi:hypothetical protein